MARAKQTSTRHKCRSSWFLWNTKRWTFFLILMYYTKSNINIYILLWDKWWHCSVKRCQCITVIYRQLSFRNSNLPNCDWFLGHAGLKVTSYGYRYMSSILRFIDRLCQNGPPLSPGICLTTSYKSGPGCAVAILPLHGAQLGRCLKVTGLSVAWAYQTFCMGDDLIRFYSICIQWMHSFIIARQIDDCSV